MEEKFFGLLYRNGPETASNTRYMLCVDHFLGMEEEKLLNLVFITRYDGLSGGLIDRIVKEIDRYKGPQNRLVQRINTILRE